MSLPSNDHRFGAGAAPAQRPRPGSLTVDGVLIVAVELRAWLGYGSDAPDHLFVFRRVDCWTLLTLWRRERWSDDGVQRPLSGRACVSVQEVGPFAALAKAVRDRYGEAGWRAVLEAGRDEDADLFTAWVPAGIERDLDRAVCFRPDLVRQPAPLDALTLAGLRVELAEHFAGAGFREVSVAAPPRAARRGENLVVARAVLHRYGHEACVIVRMDPAGEVYARLADPDDGFGPALRALDEDVDA